MKIELILYPLLAATLAIIIYHMSVSGSRARQQEKVIDSMKQIAQSMMSGDSLETAMTKVDCNYFTKVLELMNSGMTIDMALKDAAKNDKVLMYIADVISLTVSSKGNIIVSLNRLSNKLWEVNHLQKRIDEKASAAITTLQVMGIAVMPAIFYFLAGILSTEEWLVQVDLTMQIYLGFMMLVFTMLNYIIFKDLKGSMIVLPFSAVLYALYILSLGPLLYGLF
ncbi:hypothetical protein H6503_04180 [Candidatus Woesearchaeota archaeon]|nr:hypothetical protein [Candidatus Woesearchaeota archaeon]